MISFGKRHSNKLGIGRMLALGIAMKHGLKQRMKDALENAYSTRAREPLSGTSHSAARQTSSSLCYLYACMALRQDYCRGLYLCMSTSMHGEHGLFA